MRCPNTFFLDELKYSESDNDCILFNPNVLINPTNSLHAQLMCAAIANGRREIPYNNNCSYFLLGFLCRLLLIVQPFLSEVEISLGGDSVDEEEFILGFKLIENPKDLLLAIERWRIHLQTLDIQLVDQDVSE